MSTFYEFRAVYSVEVDKLNIHGMKSHLRPRDL